MSGKYYVYAICDPQIPLENDQLRYKPLYVGKGCGKRHEIHLKEARGLVTPQHKNTLKLQMLQEVLESGHEPVTEIIHTGLERDAAYDFERDLIKKYGRVGIDENGILANRVLDQRTLGGGKKGMKQSKSRSAEHRAKLSQSLTGRTYSDGTRRLWSEQRRGRKQTAKQKQILSSRMSGSSNPNALRWTVTTPTGEIHEVVGLRKWATDQRLNYYDIYYSRHGYQAVKHGKGNGGRKPVNQADDKIGARFKGHVLVRDKDTNEVLLDKFNSIHLENMSETIALALMNFEEGHITEMVFGNGASTVSGTGAITYLAPNTVGQDAQLYNQTYAKLVDNRSPLMSDADAVKNHIDLKHVAGNVFTDIIVTCTLDYNEPAGQEAFDDTTDLEGAFVFDELGLKSYSATDGGGLLLTHVIFHPIQKSLNRVIEIVYTLRIYMS